MGRSLGYREKHDCHYEIVCVESSYTLPLFDVLDFVQYYVEPSEVLFRNDLVVKGRPVAVSVIPDGFHVVVEDVRIRSSVIFQQFDELPQQCGFPASSHAGNDLDDILVLESQEFIEIACSEHISCHDRRWPRIYK